MEGAAPRPGCRAQDLGMTWSGFLGSSCGERSHGERLMATGSQSLGAPKGQLAQGLTSGTDGQTPGGALGNVRPGRGCFRRSLSPESLLFWPSPPTSSGNATNPDQTPRVAQKTAPGYSGGGGGAWGFTLFGRELVPARPRPGPVSVGLLAAEVSPAEALQGRAAVSGRALGETSVHVCLSGRCSAGNWHSWIEQPGSWWGCR